MAGPNGHDTLRIGGRTSLFRCRSGSRPLDRSLLRTRKPPTSRQCRPARASGRRGRTSWRRPSACAKGTSICSGIGASHSVTPSTGTSTRSPGADYLACTGAASTRSTRWWSEIARWCGSSIDISGSCTSARRTASRATSDTRWWPRVTSAPGCAANPPGVGINWASSLEAALRIIAWCWTLQLFRQAPEFSGWLFRELARWIVNPCAARRTIPLVLLFAEHAPHRRSAGTLLRRCPVSRAREGRPMARS